MIRALILAGAAALLAGCAAAPPVDTERLGSAPVLLEVPFHPQTAYHCGPAALASVLGWSGEQASPEALAEAVYLPGRKGALQAELVAAARSRGRLAYQLSPSLDVLLTEVRAEHPVLVLQNLSFDWAPQWHYAVVVGYDLVRHELVLHTGTLQAYRVDIDTFHRTWERAGGWALVTLPPGRVPASAGEEDYLRAVAGLEEVGQTPAAELGYAAALRRWPESVKTRLALAALRYRDDDAEAAELLLREALEREPDSVPAMNNLAHVLMERGERGEAERLARRALADPGPYRSEVEDTLQRIRGR